MQPLVRVTINTDASFHPKEKFGGFAYWIVYDGNRIKGAGAFKDKCCNSNDAEIKAIINALSTLLSKNIDISKVIFNTDSKNAIKELTKSGVKTDLKKAFDNLIYGRQTKIDFEFRHVKAHSGIGDKRSFVNEWCDENAKIHMRKQLK